MEKIRMAISENSLKNALEFNHPSKLNSKRINDINRNKHIR